MVWPYSERKDGDKVRKKYLGPQHLRGKYACFAFSPNEKGLFCIPCVLFGVKSADGNTLARLVHSPLRNFSHLTGRDGYLTTHLSKKYHEDSCSKADKFKKVASGAVDVYGQLNKVAEEEKQRNRKILERLLEAIVFLGRCGLPFRAHRDSGPLSTETSECSQVIDYDRGNFRAILQLMMTSGDTVLKQHVESCKRNASYISWLAQNELIEAVAVILTKDMVSEVNKSKFFTLMADETTDASGKEQLSICLRYVTVSEDVHVIKERLLALEEAPDLTGAGLAQQLLNTLQRVGIDATFMVGQCYDGAAAMSGHKNGVQKFIQDRFPRAIFSHCASHRLNLCLLKACRVRDIQSAMTMMKEIAVFFRDSNKRLAILHHQISIACPESAHSRLKKHCCTRWVENQEAVIVFKELYPAVVSSFDELACSRDVDVVGKSTTYLKAIRDAGFLVSLEVITAVMNVTKSLSQKLQCVNESLTGALDSIDSCKDVIQSFRDDEAVFERLFTQSEQNYGDKISMPRVVGRQMNKANPPASSPAQFYRRSIFLPFIDTTLEQLNERFSSKQVDAAKLQNLIPTKSLESDFDLLKNSVVFYSAFLDNNVEAVESEFLRWKSYWQRRKNEDTDVPNNVLDALTKAKKLSTFPNLTVLLQILATLPVTTATNERSFSALKYLKTYLRTTMKQVRLNGLALLYIHRDMKLDFARVIDEFGRKNRRLKFI